MQSKIQRITPFLWFDTQAEEAAAYYVSIFDHSRIVTTTRYGKEAAQASGQKEGSAMTVASTQRSIQSATRAKLGSGFTVNR